MTSFPPRPAFQASRIGVLSGREVIGDGLIKIPFLRALRAAWPQAEILWITTQGPSVYSGVLMETVRPLIDRVEETPDWLSASRAQKPSFDLLIDTRGRWKLALAARLSIPHRLFIAPAFRYLFSDRRPPLLSARPGHLVDRLLQTVELAAGYAPQATGRLPSPPDLLAKARRILPEGQIYVGFAPGAGNPAKIWPAERFERAAQHQVRLNRVPVFLLGPDEMGLYDRLFRAVPEAIFPLQARDVWGTRAVSVEETLALGHLLDVAVVNDSGTSHMLAAVDCPLVSLFGPTEAAKLAPRVTHRALVTAQSFGRTDMDAIPLESVLESVNHVLLQRGRV